ncbi:unnamed protein product [Larinioides sclopetarius]|uniref:Uncharacterized protein n=1 Tax=Larinioides sclopetarius TaxID=280406 RepID=A0AAV2BFN9_9ARAC
MGSGLSTSSRAAVKLTNDKCYRTDSNRNQFKTSDKKIAHYAIVKMNDLYYFNDFPFPYLESIVLYYKKYKFKDTKLTNQAFLEPYLRTQQNKRKSSRSLISSSVDNLNNETIENDKTWTYGHYKSLSTRL